MLFSVSVPGFMYIHARVCFLQIEILNKLLKFSYQLFLNAAVTCRRPTAIPVTLNNIVLELESLPGFTTQVPFIAPALTLQKFGDKRGIKCAFEMS